MSTPYSTRGFTIVELLIVIVVIGILSAIIVVAFNGLNTRANDSSVQSDIRNNLQIIAQYQSEFGLYPTETQLSTRGVKFSKGSYQVADNAALYCVVTDGSTFALIGKSKSGTTYYASSTTGGVRTATFAFPTGGAADCPNAGSSNGTGSRWLHTLTNGWLSWVQG